VGEIERPTRRQTANTLSVDIGGFCEQLPKPGTNTCGYAKFVCLALEHNEKQTFWSSFV